MREAVHMRNFFRHFAKDESGMGVVEVILIIVEIYIYNNICIYNI